LQVLQLYLGDRWNVAGPGGVANASYVWLPLLPAGSPAGGEAGSYELTNVDGWKLSDYQPAPSQQL
jgi:hypothetical protein